MPNSIDGGGASSNLLLFLLERRLFQVKIRPGQTGQDVYEVRPEDQDFYDRYR